MDRYFLSKLVIFVQMFQSLKTYYSVHPLRTILIVALLIRMVAVLFSKGYGMHDDHFLTIEPAQAWAENNFEYNDWLDEKRATETPVNPSGHSLFYPGILYLIFKFCDSIGFTDPQLKMYLIRFLHALFSLLIVYFGYRIARKLKDENTAKKTGWLLALFWLLPVASVHNFVELVCIPPLLASSWYLLQYDEEKSTRNILLSTFWLAIAFAIRFQVLFFFAGVGLYFLFRRQWIHGIIYFFGTLFFYFITQLPDLFVWGKAFVLNQNYIDYNFKNAEAFTTHPFYQYFIVISALAIPPLCFFLWAGYFKDMKRTSPVFLPSLLFFLFHSYFPNKQERFILPFLPYLIILGMVGWQSISESYQKWFTNKKFQKGIWIFFWIINCAGLILLTPSYSKRSRVESMTFLSTQENVNALIIENSHADYTIQLPMFYLGKWVYCEMVPKGYPITHLYDVFGKKYKDFPHYIIFIENKDLENRVVNYQKEMNQDLEFLKEIESGYLDKLIYNLNPKNRNFTFYIYKVIPF